MNKYLSILILIICISCAESGNNEHGPPYLIDLTKPLEKGSLVLSDFVENIEYIVPDTAKGWYINWIYGIRVFEDKLIIRDRKTVKIYNQKGNPQLGINKQGRGPGEYTSIVDFDVDSQNGDIIILSSGRKLLRYSIEDGSFREEQKLAGPVWTIRVLDNEHYYCGFPPVSGAPDPLHTIINRSGDTICFSLNKFLFESDVKVGFNNETSSYRTQNGVFYSELLNDTLYSVSVDKGFLPYAIYNRGEERFTIEKRNSPALEQGLNESILVTNFFEIPGFLISTMHYRERNRTVIYNISSGESLVGDDGIPNDIDGGLPLEYVMMSNDSIIISTAMPADIQNHLIPDDYFPKSDKFLKIKSSIDIESNPVIVKYILKR